MKPYVGLIFLTKVDQVPGTIMYKVMETHIENDGRGTIRLATIATLNVPHQDDQFFAVGAKTMVVEQAWFEQSNRKIKDLSI